GGGGAGRSGARRGLGHRDGRDDLAADKAGQPPLLLLLGGQADQIRRHDVGLQAEPRADRAGRVFFLGEDRVVAEVLQPHAAILFRRLPAEETEFARPQPDLARGPSVALPFLPVRQALLLVEATGRLTERVMLGLEDLPFHALPPAWIVS